VNRKDLGRFQFDQVLVEGRNDGLQMDHEKGNRGGHVAQKVRRSHVDRIGCQILDDALNRPRQFAPRVVVD
jgi:hypothetical protein